MNVIIVNDQSDLIIVPNLVEELVSLVISFEQKKTDEVSVHFITNQKITEMHREYFDDPTPTDCISFPIDCDDTNEYSILGDIFVCPSMAVSYANSQNTNPYEELSLYIVHGMLHLMGYNDLEEGEVQLMRGAEERHMAHLRERGKLLS